MDPQGPILPNLPIDHSTSSMSLGGKSSMPVMQIIDDPRVLGSIDLRVGIEIFRMNIEDYTDTTVDGRNPAPVDR